MLRPVFRAYQRAIGPSIANPRYAFFGCAVDTALSSSPWSVGGGVPPCYNALGASILDYLNY
jgi:hypothetical protein